MTSDELAEAERHVRSMAGAVWPADLGGNDYDAQALSHVMAEYDRRGVELDQVSDAVIESDRELGAAKRELDELRDALVVVECDDPEHAYSRPIVAAATALVEHWRGYTDYGDYCDSARTAERLAALAAAVERSSDD